MKARILIVDDEYGMLRAAERVLAPRHDVTVFAHPQEALERAPQLRPDLALLDIRMPDMDGFELMARLKEIQPDIDVILMTGSITDPDRKLVRALREKAFYYIQKPFDSAVLTALVDRCLDLRRLETENRRHTARMEKELAQARAFQQGLLPAPVRSFDGVSAAFRYDPSSELGGDFCDYAPAGPGRIGVVLADVSGHGVGAAMMTALVKSSFHASRDEEFDPETVIRRISDSIAPFGVERFVTVFCGRLDAAAGELKYVNAGHPPGLLGLPGSGKPSGGTPASPGAVRLLESTGPLVSSALTGFPRPAVTVPFPKGSRLLVYSDGISEARVGDGFYGDERIAELFGSRADSGLPLLDRILADAASASGMRAGQDDWTLLTAWSDDRPDPGSCYPSAS